MNQSSATIFFQCDTSTNLTDFVQFCFKSLCPTLQQDDECIQCDSNTEIQLLSLLHELTDIDGTNVSDIQTSCFKPFVDNTVSCYSSNDRLHFIKSLSLIIQHTRIQSSIHQLVVQLLSQIMHSNANWCSRLSDDIKLINHIIKHVIAHAFIDKYEVLLQYISSNIAIRKIPAIKGLVTHFVECIIDNDECNQYNISKLIILYNIIKSKDGAPIQRYIKSMSNVKKLYKKLSRLMSNQNMWIVLYSLFILTTLVINDPLQSQLFNKNNINIVFQLIFNLILHGASTDIKMLQISITLLSLMLSNDELIDFLCAYPKLKKTIGKLLPLLLVFDSHSLFILRLLNMLMQCDKLQASIISLLNYNRYLSVILKLCLHHTNTDYYSDFNISIQATKFITTTIKSQPFHSREYDIFVSDSHHYPRHADSASSEVSLLCKHNDEFIAETRRMCFAEHSCNVLFGDTPFNGNNIMKKLCFAGHIEDYSLLTPSQKYMMYFIELFKLICRESHEFKSRLVECITIDDLSYFLCPHASRGEPNQIFLSIINLICSLHEDIVGIGYLLKTRLCDSMLISAINHSLNSKSNSKDIGNAIQFIHYIFTILSKEEPCDANSSFISNLLHNNKENNASKRKNMNRRKHMKQRPRHYERSGLTLLNADCVSITDNNVQNMSSKILYELFCKKMVRFNKTQKGNHSMETKQIETLKTNYTKMVKSMEQKLQSKDAKMETMRSELSNKNEDFKALQQEFDDLNSHFMAIQDDNHTKKHIIKDKTEKYNELKNESNELKLHMDEMMNKLKCVCQGYNELKQESKRHIAELQSKNQHIMTTMQRKCDEMDQELKCRQENVRNVENELKQSRMDKMELKRNLDCMIGRNSELTHKYNESNRKLSETQKLTAMIQNLMSNKQ